MFSHCKILTCETHVNLVLISIGNGTMLRSITISILMCVSHLSVASDNKALNEFEIIKERISADSGNLYNIQRISEHSVLEKIDDIKKNYTETIDLIKMTPPELISTNKDFYDSFTKENLEKDIERLKQRVNKWIKYQYYISDLHYDINKTDSLINPYKAFVEVKSQWASGQYHLDKANAESERILPVEDGWDFFTANYTYTDNAWRLDSIDVKYNNIKKTYSYWERDENNDKPDLEKLGKEFNSWMPGN